MPDAVVGGFLDAVGVVAPALDGAGIGAVPAAGLRFFFVVMSALTWDRSAATIAAHTLLRVCLTHD